MFVQQFNRKSPQFGEVANVSSAFLSLFLSMIGFAILISLATRSGQWLPIIASAIYGTTLVLLFSASTLYHSILAGDMLHKRAFQIVDHCAIYLLIAGTYTPFGLITLRNDGGLILLAFLWTVAAIGCFHKIFFKLGSPIPSTLAYVAMGWSVIFVAKPLISNLEPWGFYLLALGGVSYTLGSIFFVFDHKFTLAHTVWHIFVLGGSLAHYLAIVMYVMPPLS